MDARALYYIAFAADRRKGADPQLHEEEVKANENFLNQNFTFLVQRLGELESRLEQLEGKGSI